MKANQNEVKLLPHYFQKIIGLLFVVSIIVVMFLKAYVKIPANINELIGSIILISFFLFMLTSRKVEDEMTIKLRYRAYAFAFITCIVAGVIDPYFNLIWEGEFVSTNTASDILRMGIIGYFVGYFSVFYEGEK